MRKLCVATQNAGKQREIAALLAEWRGQVLFPQDLGLEIEVAETGDSFAQNAALKARAFAAVSNLPAMADDSGLEVDALGGAPGVYSARYAGPGASDQERYRKLLAELADVPRERRTARFRCVVAVAHPNGQVDLAEGTCEGSIAFAPQGEHGFGYDPVFYLPELGCTLAQLPPQIKNEISHRARAVRAAMPLLEALPE